VTAVLADAEFGDNATLRCTLRRLKVPYALGISLTLRQPKQQSLDRDVFIKSGR
jgi:hypothetical protein